MNETQYYSAKTNNWGEVVGFEKEGYFHFLCFCGGTLHEAKTEFFTDLAPVKFVPQDAAVIEGFTLEYLEDMADFGEQVCSNNGFPNNARDFKKLRQELIAQLTPPKPEENGGIQILGGIVDSMSNDALAQELYFLGEYLETSTDRKGWADTINKLRLSLISKSFTPPKPRPEEPKIIYPQVKASILESSKKRVWTKHGDGRWSALSDSGYLLRQYSDLIDPVVLYPGQVK